MPLLRKITTTRTDSYGFISHNLLVRVGFIIFAISFAVFIIIIFPIVELEIKYFLKKQTADNQFGSSIHKVLSENDVQAPIDTDFGIMIPKIDVNARVIKDVDPNKSSEYQYKLTMGVAHAKGSSYPDTLGNVFLFAHSSDNIFNANRYNSIFYLLNKLAKDDQIIIYYNDNEYEYKVTQTRIVNKEQVEYMRGEEKNHTLTLMTCWPFGTTLKRFIVTAERIR